jgi:class 3 adenylate cyclase
VREIAEWLEKLGMSEYAQRFAENGISVAALPHLTDHDLKDIGVLLGHRRVMLAAISKLAGAAPATPEPTALAEPKPQDAAERRQVTVMFSDLVGSTALSARMDPEDLREVISAYQKCVAETVQRFGGFVAKYLGDGVLVYFGWPKAHEDDAERAVRAGLGLVAAVGALKSHAGLQTRVGIATGLVVVGDLIGRTRFSSQPLDLAANFPSHGSSRTVLRSSVFRIICGSRLLTTPDRADGARRPKPLRSRRLKARLANVVSVRGAWDEAHPSGEMVSHPLVAKQRLQGRPQSDGSGNGVPAAINPSVPTGGGIGVSPPLQRCFSRPENSIGAVGPPVAGPRAGA